MRPWVKKTLLVSAIIVVVGAGLSMVFGKHERVSEVVRVSPEFHGRPVGDMKLNLRGGEIAAVPAPRGEDVTVPGPPQAPQLREGGIHIERVHVRGIDSGIDSGVVVGGIILIAGLLLFWMSKRRKRARNADGANVLANIPSASDFLDQWEIQQNQTKESK